MKGIFLYLAICFQMASVCYGQTILSWGAQNEKDVKKAVTQLSGVFNQDGQSLVLEKINSRGSIRYTWAGAVMYVDTNEATFVKVGLTLLLDNKESILFKSQRPGPPFWLNAKNKLVITVLDSITDEQLRKLIRYKVKSIKLESWPDKNISPLTITEKARKGIQSSARFLLSKKTNRKVDPKHTIFL
jgi:hypothetical protein